MESIHSFFILHHYFFSLPQMVQGQEVLMSQMGFMYFKKIYYLSKLSRLWWGKSVV